MPQCWARSSALHPQLCGPTLSQNFTKDLHRHCLIRSSPNPVRQVKLCISVLGLTIMKDHKLGVLKQWTFYSCTILGARTKISVLAGLVPSEALRENLFPAFLLASEAAGNPWHSLDVFTWPLSLGFCCVSVAFALSYRTTTLGLGAHPNSG